MKTLALLAALGTLAALPVAGVAGETGLLTGTVTDASSGQPISGARVTVRSPSQVEQAVTDARGRFTFVALCPGTYVVAFSHPGYATIVYPGVVVRADLSSALNGTLLRPTRIIAHLDEPPGWYLLGGLGKGSDVYLATGWSMPYYGVEDSITGVLRFIPGVTFGSGMILAH
jgi:Carboxypeptidase regulatory-like domain